MSLAKITRVEKSRKPGQCEKCGTELPAGSPYIWFSVGFRSKWKHVRCTAPGCAPKQSERESSKLASVYAAMEDFEATVTDASDVDDLEQALSDFAQAIRDVAEEYEEASQDENGNVFNPQAEERAELLNEAADEVESISITGEMTDCDVCEDADESGKENCEECGGTGEIIDMDAAREEALAAIEVELP